MTRYLSAILAFYLTVAIVQIPYLQSVMPEYVKELTAAEEDYVEESYYVSIIVPKNEFNPKEENQEVYSNNLSPIAYDQVVGLLKKLPEFREESKYYYYLKIDDVDIPVSLFDKDENQITEIEFQIPLSKLDKSEKVVKAMADIASGIQGSQFYDYSGKTLYETQHQEALVEAILKNK